MLNKGHLKRIAKHLDEISKILKDAGCEKKIMCIGVSGDGYISAFVFNEASINRIDDIDVIEYWTRGEWL